MLRKNLVSGIAVTIFGLAIYLISRSFPELPEGYPGPGLFPSIIGISLTLLGLVIFFHKKDGKPENPVAVGGRTGALLVAIGLAFLLPLVNRWVPLIIVLPVFILLMALLFRTQLKWAVIISVSTSLVIYLIFSLMLGVAL